MFSAFLTFPCLPVVDSTYASSNLRAVCLLLSLAMKEIHLSSCSDSLLPCLYFSYPSLFITSLHSHLGKSLFLDILEKELLRDLKHT